MRVPFWSNVTQVTQALLCLGLVFSSQSVHGTRDHAPTHIAINELIATFIFASTQKEIDKSQRKWAAAEISSPNRSQLEAMNNVLAPKSVCEY